MRSAQADWEPQGVKNPQIPKESFRRLVWSCLRWRIFHLSASIPRRFLPGLRANMLSELTVSAVESAPPFCRSSLYRLPGEVIGSPKNGGRLWLKIVILFQVRVVSGPEIVQQQKQVAVF